VGAEGGRWGGGRRGCTLEILGGEFGELRGVGWGSRWCCGGIGGVGSLGCRRRRGRESTATVCNAGVGIGSPGSLAGSSRLAGLDWRRSWWVGLLSR